MTFFDETKSIIENLYLLSGPSLLLVAILGLRQLKIAKKSIRVNSKRQSAILTFELSHKYMEGLETDYQTLIHKMEELGIDYEKLESLNFQDITNISSDYEHYSEYEKVISHYDDLEYHFHVILNKLEAYSTPFIHEIADEEIGYNLDVFQFQQICNLCACSINLLRKNEKDNKDYILSSIVKLYKLWTERNEKHRIIGQVDRLLKKGNSIKDQRIKPIGTE